MQKYTLDGYNLITQLIVQHYLLEGSKELMDGKYKRKISDSDI